MRILDLAPILKDLMHHTFKSCLFYILGTGEKSSPQETKGSISFSSNIADVRIPFQIICNCYTKVFDIINNLLLRSSCGGVSKAFSKFKIG